MEHLLNLGSNLASNLNVMSVASDKLLTLFASEVAHIRTTSKYLTCSSNLETFHDDFSGLLLCFGHIFYYMDSAEAGTESLFFWFNLGDKKFTHELGGFDQSRNLG